MLVSVSTLASLPQVESAWNGVKEVYGEQDFGLRILRELMLAVIVVYAFLEPRLRRGCLIRRFLRFFGVVADLCDCVKLAMRCIWICHWLCPMAGLRVFRISAAGIDWIRHRQIKWRGR